MPRFTNKTAVVFAASRGIGRAVAERLGREGAAVVVNFASNAAKADEVVKAITANGGQAIAVQGNVAHMADVARVYETALAKFGKIDIVINAAGQAVFKPISDLTDADFDKVFSVNARGAMYVLSGAAKHVSDNGRIVQFSTGGTKMTMPGTGLYSASKAAGEQLALNLAKEVGHRGITVNVVSPGATDTDGLIMPKEQIGQIVAMTPLGRLGAPADVADAVTFLVSEDGRWVTGQNLQINGGIL
jgi:3-oxoacyl-[acyl-carrier protein] reductase